MPSGTKPLPEPVLNYQQWASVACSPRTILRKEQKYSMHNGETHWGRVTHISVSKLTIIGSDNGLSPGWRQAILWTNARILIIGPLRANFSEIFIEIPIFSFKKMPLKMLSGKCRPFCLGLNVLNGLGAGFYQGGSVCYLPMLITQKQVVVYSGFSSHRCHHMKAQADIRAMDK